MAASDDRICVGVVAGAHGVRGGVRIKSFTDDPTAVAAYGPVQRRSGAAALRARGRRPGQGRA